MTHDPSLDSRYLELFPSYLRTLGEDAAALASHVDGEAPEEARRYVIAALNYVFKSLDLIADGIDDLGYMDDAFVLRVAAAHAREAAASDDPVLMRLSDDAKTVREFLGDVYPRLDKYVQNLRNGAARGRTVDEIVQDDAVRAAFLDEVRAWAGHYQVPSFTRDARTLAKLKAFLSTRLP